MGALQKVKPGEAQRVMEAVEAAREQGKALPEILAGLKLSPNRYRYLATLWRQNGKAAPVNERFNRNGIVRQLEQENAHLREDLAAVRAEVTLWQARYGQLAAKQLA